MEIKEGTFSQNWEKDCMINVDTDGMIYARELHESLKIGTKYTTWFERMTSYGFEENVDFFPILGKSSGGRMPEDHRITIDMAKHICMIQRTTEGRMVRQYLIDLEKAWNTPEQVIARAVRMADGIIDGLKEKLRLLKEENNSMKPKAVFADAVSVSSNSILIGDLAKILRQNGVNTGQKRLFSYLRENGYLMKEGSSRNLPTQRYMESGLFEIKESVVSNPDGSMRTTRTTKVTGKGQIYFINMFCGEKKNESEVAV